MNSEELDKIFNEQLSGKPFSPDGNLEQVIFQKLNDGFYKSPFQRAMQYISGKAFLLSMVGLTSLVVIATISFSTDPKEQDLLTSSAPTSFHIFKTSTELTQSSFTAHSNIAGLTATQVNESNNNQLTTNKNSSLFPAPFTTTKNETIAPLALVENVSNKKNTKEKNTNKDSKTDGIKVLGNNASDNEVIAIEKNILHNDNTTTEKSNELAEKVLKLKTIPSPSSIIHSNSTIQNTPQLIANKNVTKGTLIQNEILEEEVFLAQNIEVIPLRKFCSKLPLPAVTIKVNNFDSKSPSNFVQKIEIEAPEESPRNRISLQFNRLIGTGYNGENNTNFKGILNENDPVIFNSGQIPEPFGFPLGLFDYSVNRITTEKSFNFSLNYEFEIKNQFFLQSKLDLGRSKIKLTEEFNSPVSFVPSYVYDVDGAVIIDTLLVVKYGKNKLITKQKSDFNLWNVGINIGAGRRFQLGNSLDLSVSAGANFRLTKFKGTYKQPFIYSEDFLLISNHNFSIHPYFTTELQYSFGNYGVSIQSNLSSNLKSTKYKIGTFNEKPIRIHAGVSVFYLF